MLFSVRFSTSVRALSHLDLRKTNQKYQYLSSKSTALKEVADIRASNSAKTVVFHHEDCTLHIEELQHSHPEKPQRVEAAMKALRRESEKGLLPGVNFCEAPSISEELLLEVHSENHLERIRNLCLSAEKENSVKRIDADTFVNKHSFAAASKAAGSVISAVDGVYRGDFRNAFCCTRPPGHHANAIKSMGFCLFNQAVVGLRYARKKYQIKKIAILDWDVHHGNGTQDLLWDDPNGIYVSTHQYPFYPGTGASSETGAHENVLNIPLQAGCSGIEFRKKITEALGFIASKSPELIIISAGFDAHRSDPLGGLNLTEDDFVFATSETMKVAKEHCAGRIVSVFEGGYNTIATAECIMQHVKQLSGVET